MAAACTACLLILVALVGRAILLGIRQRSAPNPINPLLAPPPPLTAAERKVAADFGRELAAKIEEGNPEELAALIDLPGLTQRITGGTRLPDDARSSLRLELSRQNGIVFRYLAGSACHVLRLAERDGFPALVLRSESRTQGLTYFDVLLRPKDEAFRVVDIFAYNFGTFSSDEMRESTLRLLSADQRMARQLGNAATEDPAIATALLESSRAIQGGDWQGAARLLRDAPPSVQAHRGLYMIRLTSLSRLQENPEYEAEFEQVAGRARAVLGTNCSPGLILYNLHCRKKDFAAAVRDIDALLSLVGRDAGLLNLKADASLRGGQTSVARECLEEAVRLEPDYPVLVDLRIKVLATEGRFEAAAEAVRSYFGKTGGRPTEDMFEDELYAQFRASSQFKSLFQPR